MRDITDAEFESVVGFGRVLVEFYSTNCPPCRALGPILDRLAKDLPDVVFVKVNVDNHMEHASKLGLTSVPTLVLYDNGQEIKRHVGLISATDLTAWVCL